MKIAVFTYTFGTRKTQEGLARLALYGFKPHLMLAAPPVPLNFYHSKIRIAPRGLSAELPQDMAAYYGINYVVCPHSSPTCCAVLRNYDIDVAVILGARIIKQPTIDAVRYGIINLHPGKLPVNRGLDNVKWAILKKLPQAATAHYIDASIDRGWFLCDKEVPVFRDDTMLDIHLRIQDAERDLMVQALRQVTRMPERENYHKLEEGCYHKAVLPDVEATLGKSFEEYKALYAKD